VQQEPRVVIVTVGLMVFAAGLPRGVAAAPRTGRILPLLV
jgi:hypothetical protein